MVNIVVGVGYIGSRLVQELLYQGREVIGFDNLFSTDKRAIVSFRLSPGFTFVEGSILDRQALDRTFDLAAGQLEAVYVLAAQASAHPDAASPEYTEAVNLRGPRLLLDALSRRKATAPVVYASSLRVHGSPLPPVVDESTPYGAVTDLSHLTKVYAEKLLEFYAGTRGLSCRIVRLGLTYGVAPVLKTDHRFMTAPNLFCLRAARGEPIEVRTADAVALVHVDDAARGLLWAGERFPADGYAVFNLATEVAYVSRIASVVVEIAAERDLPAAVISVARTGEERRLPGIHSSLIDAGFAAQRHLREGLAETLDHFLVRGQ